MHPGEQPCRNQFQLAVATALRWFIVDAVCNARAVPIIVPKGCLLFDVPRSSCNPSPPRLCQTCILCWELISTPTYNKLTLKLLHVPESGSEDGVDLEGVQEVGGLLLDQH